MPRHEVQHALAVLPAAVLDFLAEDTLGAPVVELVHVEEARAKLERQERPAGEAARDFDDVLLGVAAIDAQGVELEQLAGVVFVQAAPLLLLRRAARLAVRGAAGGGGGSEERRAGEKGSYL